MGKRNKVTGVAKNGEINLKTKNMSAEMDNGNINFPKSSKKKKTSKFVDQNSTETERTQKKVCTGNEEDVDKKCNELQDVNKNQLSIIDHKIKTSKKNKSCDYEELLNVPSPKAKKVKTKIEDHKPNVVQMKSNNKKNDHNDVSESRQSLVKNKLNFLNKDEAEVNEDDIDKYCDEITEEDNETYENWVKLFEANFKKCKDTS